MFEDESWIYNQAGAIPWKRDAEGVQILLITTRRRRRWIIPKGIVEEHQTAAEAARDEAYEEAGVEGLISSNPVGKYQYRKWGGTCTVTVFLLEVKQVSETWPEAYFRERRWVDPETAVALIDQEELRLIIRRASELLEATI